ncbi:MAG: 8-amino-7-oxononanoate synthase [Verrucomicrobiales bacterium]|nr:8-amino-7-oxononanoate synthase [Verrucomicrobiales bacterium]
MRDPDEELKALEARGLRRHLRRLNSPQQREIDLEGTGQCLNFSSNDYLGLTASPRLKRSFKEYLETYGVGSGASRLVCGTMDVHLELEEKLAALKGSEAALTFASGFATATGILPALCGKDDFIILDKLCHASLIDGARLSGATMRIYPHNDLEKLSNHLAWARGKAAPGNRIMVVTESVFSMDGDRAPLAEIVDLKDEVDALLLLDEAHAFGLIGPEGRGLAAEQGLESRVDLQMGTFSKAAGLSGGYVCASRDLVDLLINRARSFIYSSAPAPALAATISDAIDLIAGDDGAALRTRLWNHLGMFSETAESAIFPHVIGENDAALDASDTLLKSGFLVPAIRYPTVPRGTARLRITLSASHLPEDIASLKNALALCLSDC